MSKPHILIIDDDINYMELMSESLEDDFEVKAVGNLVDANQLFENGYECDVALVDEFLGEDKGSEWIAKQIQTNVSVKSFVLYSGMANEDAIIKGLECGADDFISKPISLNALHKKLQKLIEYHQQLQGFEVELESKDNVINISMAQASKYGSCMQLTSKLNQCFSHEQIRNQVFSFLDQLDLQCCMAFYPINEFPSFYHSVKGACSPTEVQVMELLRVKPRLYTFGSRTIFNHPLVSMLILNMEPGTLDADIYIDTFASVIECIGARMEFITYQTSLNAIQEQIGKAVMTTKSMVEVSKQHQQEIMNEIVQGLGMSFHVLDMSEEQEQYLTDLVHKSLKKHSQDDINFLEVSKLLDDALYSLDELKELNRESSLVEETLDDDDDFLL